MAYEKKVSRALPCLIIVLTDDSCSMSDKLPGTSDPKFLWVERYFGIILQELLARCTEMKGEEAVIKPRYYLTVIRYGSQPSLWGSPEMDIETAVRLFTDGGNSLGLGGYLSGTDAKAAFAETLAHLKTSLAGERFKNSFPPMLFHLSDGESATGAAALAQEAMQQSTADGCTLVVNAYIGTRTRLNYTGPEDFPGYTEVSEVGSREDNIRLFEMSSEVPPCLEANLKADGIFPQLRPGSRLFFDVRTKDMLKHVIQVIGSLNSRMER